MWLTGLLLSYILICIVLVIEYKHILNTLVMDLIIFVKSLSAGLHGGLINTIL